MDSFYDLFQLIASNAWIYGGAFILVLSVLVFIHEWGHYIVAVKNGVYVESFSIGFGKELFGFTDKRGTRWKVSLFPLGGYVKMFGDVDPASSGKAEGVVEEGAETIRPFTEDEKKVAFFAQSVGARMAIVFAGPAINFIFAILVLAVLYATIGQPVTPPVVGGVVRDAPSLEAGFKPHDRILKINNKPIQRFEDLQREVMIALDTPLKFEIQRGEDIVELTAIPEKIETEDRFGFPHAYGFLGVISIGNAMDIEHITKINGEIVETNEQRLDILRANMGQQMTIELDRGEEEPDKILIQPLEDQNENLGNAENVDGNVLFISRGTEETILKHAPLVAFFQAIHETSNITLGTLKALGQMVTGTRSATELGGIIRIGAMAGDMAQNGLIALITFSALLSINLGLINLFPIPMLDGGHLVFYILEALRGSPISEQIQEYAFRMGMIFLVGIMLFANLNDIVQLIQ